MGEIRFFLPREAHRVGDEGGALREPNGDALLPDIRAGSASTAGNSMNRKAITMNRPECSKETSDQTATTTKIHLGGKEARGMYRAGIHFNKNRLRPNRVNQSISHGDSLGT